MEEREITKQPNYLLIFKIIMAICTVLGLGILVLPFIKINVLGVLGLGKTNLGSQSFSMIQILLSNTKEYLAFCIVPGIALILSLINLIVVLVLNKGKPAYITTIVLSCIQTILLVLTIVMVFFINKEGDFNSLGIQTSALSLHIGFYLLLVCSVAKVIVAIVMLVVDRASKNMELIEESENHESDIEEEETKYIAHKLIVTEGEYLGAEIELEAGKRILIGRDQSKVNLVLNDLEISGVHCSIEWSDIDKKFIIKDYSKNGVYYDNGIRLPKDEKVKCSPNTVIKLGRGNEKFLLR